MTDHPDYRPPLVDPEALRALGFGGAPNDRLLKTLSLSESPVNAMRLSVIGWMTTDADVERSIEAILRIARS